MNVVFADIRELREWLLRIQEGINATGGQFARLRGEEARESALRAIHVFVKGSDDDKGIEQLRGEIKVHPDIRGDFERGLPELLKMSDEDLSRLVATEAGFIFRGHSDARKWIETVSNKLLG